MITESSQGEEDFATFEAASQLATNNLRPLTPTYKPAEIADISSFVRDATKDKLDTHLSMSGMSSSTSLADMHEEDEDIATETSLIQDQVDAGSKTQRPRCRIMLIHSF